MEGPVPRTASTGRITQRVAHTTGTPGYGASALRGAPDAPLVLPFRPAGAGPGLQSRAGWVRAPGRMLTARQTPITAPEAGQNRNILTRYSRRKDTMSRGALAAAVEAAATAALDAAEGITPPDGTVAPVAPEAGAETPSSQGAEAEVEAVSATGSETEALTPAGEEGTEEPPLTYFGVDLSGLPADQRAEVIAQWSERDRATNLAQREAAEARKAAELAAQAPAAPVEEAQPAPEDLSDEVLAQALGLDLEDPTDAAMAPRLVPMARVILELKDTVESLQNTTSASAEEVRWTSKLNELEETNGPLPVDRSELLARAVDMRITDPEVAYWAVAGPVRSQLAAEVSKRLAEQRTAGAKGATTPRPKNVADVVPGALKSTNTKDAVAEAAEMAAKELGFDWADSWRKR